MWERSQLKERAKERFRANYWMTVLVAFILILISGGSDIPNGDSNFNFGNHSNYNVQDSGKQRTTEYDEYGNAFDVVGGEKTNEEESTAKASDQGDNYWNSIGQKVGEVAGEKSKTLGDAALAIVIILIILISTVLCFAIIAVSVFVFNPLYVGCQRFFLKNLVEKSTVREVGFMFKNHYKNGVKVMFFKDLYTFLWSLLFIIPGIVKGYEYRMIPYLLAVHPDMDMQEAFARSKEMMDGNKWEAFVLDLSFILWEIASLCTLGILGIFYVNPYVFQTDAALYEALNGGTGFEDDAIDMTDVYTEI